MRLRWLMQSESVLGRPWNEATPAHTVIWFARISVHIHDVMLVEVRNAAYRKTQNARNSTPIVQQHSWQCNQNLACMCTLSKTTVVVE